MTSTTSFFVATPVPTDQDVKQIAETVAARAIRLLERRGVIGEQDPYDAFSEESPVLAGMTAASVRGMIATGDRAKAQVKKRATPLRRQTIAADIQQSPFPSLLRYTKSISFKICRLHHFENLTAEDLQFDTVSRKLRQK